MLRKSNKRGGDVDNGGVNLLLSQMGSATGSFRDGVCLCLSGGDVLLSLNAGDVNQFFYEIKFNLI
jgi:hypothetical protein